MEAALVIGIAGTLVAAFGVGVPLWVFFGYQREKKALDVSILADVSPSAALSELGLRHVTLAVSSEEVKVLRVTDIELENSGNRDLQREDFLNPIALRCAGNERIFRGSVVRTRPPGIEPNLEYDERSVQLSPTLLNAGESIVIRMLTASPLNDAIVVSMQVKGIAQREQKLVAETTPETDRPRGRWAQLVSVLASGATAAGAAVAVTAFRLLD